MENLFSWIKKLSLDFIVFLSIYLMPIYEQGFAILILMGIDFLTGIIASKKKGIPITSKNMRFSLYKFISYIIAMVSSLIFTQHFGLDILIVVSFFIASVEIKSIFENLLVINPKANLLGILVALLKSEKNEHYKEKDDNI